MGPLSRFGSGPMRLVFSQGNCWPPRCSSHPGGFLPRPMLKLIQKQRTSLPSRMHVDGRRDAPVLNVCGQHPVCENGAFAPRQNCRNETTTSPDKRQSNGISQLVRNTRSPSPHEAFRPSVPQKRRKSVRLLFLTRLMDFLFAVIISKFRDSI